MEESKSIEKEFKKLDAEEKRIKLENDSIDRRIKIFNRLGWAAIIIGIIVGVGGVIYFSVQAWVGQEVKLSEIGDYLGGTVASLWSLSGLFFIYVAFLGQQKQMILQNLELQFSRIELKATRYELEGQKNQMIKQNQAFQSQRFENTFFNLMQVHQNVLKDTRRSIKDGTEVLYQGRDFFTKTREWYLTLYKMFQKIWKDKRFNETHSGHFKVLLSNQGLKASRLISYFEEKGYSEEDVSQMISKSIFNEFQSTFAHYFRNIYTILNFIHISQRDELERLKEMNFDEFSEVAIRQKYSNYISFFQAQLSAEELFHIFYNGLLFPKMKNLLEEFKLLENLPIELLLNPKHERFYNIDFKRNRKIFNEQF